MKKLDENLVHLARLCLLSRLASSRKGGTPVSGKKQKTTFPSVSAVGLAVSVRRTVATNLKNT
jgi:hypothetical protein